MEQNRETKIPRHREWRRIAKRERRRRLRRKAAQERNDDEERLRATLERTAEYSNWIAEQEKAEREREIEEQREHDEKQQLWLEEEVRAQKEWRIQQERRAKIRQEQQLQEEIIRKEFEAKQEALRLKREETQRLRDEEMKKHEDLQRQIDDYIDNGASTPEELRKVSETQSGKEPCPFFTKTGACRYGDICSRNHRRFALTKTIMIPGFYTHFSLEKNSAEYDTDVSLEFDSAETRKHFRDFYESVLPEFKSFGRIKTLKYCRNTEIHLRGNLYVEYYTEREAARALRKLKGRYYAQRQLNCEFVNLTSWRNAVCGMTKCPKGRACNFLHTFRNPNDEYDIKSPPRWAKKNEGNESSSSRRSEHRPKSKWDDWERENADESRNWRWSESPEPEIENRGKSERSRREIDERESDRRRYSRSDRKRDDSEKSDSRSSRRDSQKRDDTSRRSRRSEDSGRQESSSRKRDEKSRKRLNETNGDETIVENYSKVPRRKKSKRRSMDHDERKITRHRSRTRGESDENVDTNSINLRLSPSKEKEKSSERTSQTIDDKKNSQTPQLIVKTSSMRDNEWDTTDSE